MLTERQEAILNAIIEEHIKRAEPIGSQLLAEHYDFGIKKAMLRREMQRLTEENYLKQSHASAGRIPTDRGYRFFVNKFLEEELVPNDISSLLPPDLNAIDDKIIFFHRLAKSISEATSELVLGYLADINLLLKEGWEKAFQQPELQDSQYLNQFIAFISKIEKELDILKFESDYQIYIGRENPLVKTDDFSMLIAKCKLSQVEDIFLTIIGPKRMPYRENIRLLRSVAEFLQNLL